MSEATNQVPGMPHAICHACGLGQKCANIECPNAGGQEPWEILDLALRRSVVVVHRSCWQPIERAPMDGTQILMACEFMPGDWRIKTGGFDAERGRWHLFGASWTPTHWQPLPDPPT